MTTDNAKAKFAELSPEQRQLLFEKIRQKKLSNARRPVEEAESTGLNPYQVSPHQALLFQRLQDSAIENRLLEIHLEGEVNLTALQQAVSDLADDYPVLNCALDSNGFKPAGEVTHFEHVDLSDLQSEQDKQNAKLNEIYQHIKTKPQTAQCLQLKLIDCGNLHYRLLFSAHPLLLDNYSLLRFANQLISLVSGVIERDKLKPADTCRQPNFANWSEQVLDKKFLRNEWNRLAPPSLMEAEPQDMVLRGNSFNQFISNDLVQQYASQHATVKQWLCSALHQCLTSWLSYNDITYWFSDPLLKDNEFENLLGFFPYYVPVKAQGSDEENFNVSAQLSQLHTRYAAVSEHLAHQLCQNGSQMPLLHYHWFDIDESENQSLRVKSIQHLNSGFMLASIEIHVTEHANGISLNVHFDPMKLGMDQAQFMTRELMSLLKQDKNVDPSKRPSLPEQLRSIWQELLQVNSIAPEQSFFELGGHSLQVTEMKFRIKQQLKVDIPISVLYELPTIEKLSSFILATHGNSLGMTPNPANDEEQEEEEGTL